MQGSSWEAGGDGGWKMVNGEWGAIRTWVTVLGLEVTGFGHCGQPALHGRGRPYRGRVPFDRSQGRRFDEFDKLTAGQALFDAVQGRQGSKEFSPLFLRKETDLLG